MQPRPTSQRPVKIGLHLRALYPHQIPPSPHGFYWLPPKSHWVVQRREAERLPLSRQQLSPRVHSLQYQSQEQLYVLG
jgi:hypothetical protein